MKVGNFVPLMETVTTYDKKNFRFDVMAALTVAVVALPQSMAYAMIAGVNPAYGLYAAIVLTILGSAFGSSNHLATGPTNAISLLVASYMAVYLGQNNFFATLFLLTFLVGAIQFSMGILKLGSLVNYVSHAVIVGFTAGAGVIIALGQLNNLLGISLPGGKMSTLEKVSFCIQNISSTNLVALGLGIFCLVFIVICKKINKSIPGALLSIVISVVLVIMLGLQNSGLKMAGEIPQAIPPLSMPTFSLAAISDLIGGAAVIAIIGLVEAVAISKSIATNTGQKINTSQEFIGQGIANMGGAFFSCIPGSGSFTRSAITYQNGGRTRLAGILVGIFILVMLIFFAPYAKYIPNASLAGVIMTVAYSMIDKKAVVKVLKTNKNDAIVLLVTMLTVIFAHELEYGIYAGVAVSLILYLKDSGVSQVRALNPVQTPSGQLVQGTDGGGIGTVNPPISIIQLQGNLYFGCSADLEEKLSTVHSQAEVYIIRFAEVSIVDITAMEIVENFINHVKHDGKRVILSGVNDNVYYMLEKMNITKHIGEENIFRLGDETVAFSGKPVTEASNYLQKINYSADHVAHA
jgi:SulP family sulfate permease